jgi:cytochrome c oxidase assembly protein Cox11
MNPSPIDPEGETRRARQRSRNRVLALALVFMAVLFFAITYVRIGQNAG